MPPAYTPSQRSAIAQFVSFTSAKESAAAKQLKAQGWNVEQAVDVYVYTTFFAFIIVFYLENIILLLSIFVRQGYKNPGDQLKSCSAPAFLLLIIKAKEEQKSLPGLRDAAAQLETKLYKMQGEIDEEEASTQLLEMQMDPNRVYQKSLTGLLDEDEVPRSLTGAHEDDPSHGIDEAHAMQIRRRQHLRDFKYWFENAHDPASELTREILCDMFRLELRRPLISDDELRSYLVSIGIDKDCENPGKDREYRLRSTQRHEIRNNPSEVHASTKFAHVLPGGYDHSTWKASNNESPFVTSPKDLSLSAPFQSSGQLMKNDEPEAMEAESIEDMANAITLYRQGKYTIGQTMDVIKRHLAGLKFNVNEYLQEIDDPNSEVNSLAMCMLKTAIDDGPSDGDDDEDESSDEESNNDSQSEYLINLKLEEEAAAKPKGKVKIRFTIGGRFRSIYYDVMQGHLPLDKAPKLFREALEQPDMPTVELVKVLLKYDVPPDLFFREEDITASAELDQSVDGKHVRFDEDTIRAELTPEQSRRSSAWINSESRPQTNYPDTPPDDSAFGTNISGRYAGPEGYKETQMSPEQLAYALQKSIDETSEHGCRIEGVGQEEADIPEVFYEEVSDAAEEAEVPDKFYDTSEARPNPEFRPALETTSSGSSSIDAIDTVQMQYISSLPNPSITELHSSSDPKNGQKTISAAQPGSKLPPESSPQSLEAGIIVSTQQVPTCPKNFSDSESCPPAPSQNLSMEHQYNDSHIRDQSSEPLGGGSRSASPENGVTSDLWGLAMPTQTARELASRMSLPKKCIQKIASHTPRRNAKKRDKIIAGRVSLPHLKRKRSSTSSAGCGSKAAKVEFQTLMFADEGDGRSKLVEKQVVPESRTQDSSSQDCCTNGRCHHCAWYVENIQSAWYTISGTILPTINKVNRLDFSRKRLATQMRESLENLIVENAEHLEYSNSKLASQLKSSLDGLNLHATTGNLHGAATTKAVRSEASRKKSEKVVENLLQNQKASARTISSLRQHQLTTSQPKQSALEHSPFQRSPISGLSDGTVKVDNRTPRKCTAKEESELNMLRWLYYGKMYVSKVPVIKLEEKDDIVCGIPDQPNGGWRKFCVISRAHKNLYENKLRGRNNTPALPASIWDFLHLCDEQISDLVYNPQSQISSNSPPGHAQSQPSLLCLPSSNDSPVPVLFEPYEGEVDTARVSTNADRTKSVSLTEVADDPDEGLELCRQSNCFTSHESISSDRKTTPTQASALPRSARTRCTTGNSGEQTPIDTRKCIVATITNSATEHNISPSISAALTPPLPPCPSHATSHVGAGDIAHVENISVPSSSLPSSPCPPRASLLGVEDSRNPRSSPPCSSGSCSEGELQTPQPCQPPPNDTQHSWPESCDIWEAAWDDKASIFVFLWRRRNMRSRTKKTAALRYFQNSTPSIAKSNTTPNLNKLFDKYRDDPESLETIGTSGTMQYLTDLGVQLDEPAVLAVLTELSAPTMGELTRDGFISGWKTYNADTLPKQQSSLSAFRSQLSKDPDYFRRVYRHAFFLARMPGQKAVQLDTAIDFWRLLFGPGGVRWADAHTDWLELWVAFLEAKWKKSVNKDMWDQTGVFAGKCLEDREMGWWSEDGAWPGVLDDFVVFVREKRGNEAAGGGEVDRMDVE